MALKIQSKNGEVPTVKSPFADELGDAPLNKALKPDPLMPDKPKMVQNSIVGHVQTTGGGSIGVPDSDEQEEMYSPAIPADKLHTISVGGKRKIMLENFGGPKYESAEIFVSVTMPCTKESMDDAYDFGSKWVSDRIAQTLINAKKGQA